MPVPVQDFIVIPDAAPVAVRLEPAHNAVYSILLVHRAEDTSGFGEWVGRTAAALTPQEQETNELVIIGFFYAVLPQQSWPSFPAYLDHLATMDPVALRDKMLGVYARFLPQQGRCFVEMRDEPPPLDLDAILQSAETYVEFLQERFPEGIVDPELETRAYAYVADPPAMQERIVSHLRHMWEQYLAPEWARVEPMLQDAVEAFRQVDFSGMSRFEAAQQIVGQELDEEQWKQILEMADQVVFVPSAHVGPYHGKYCAGKTLWVLFGARLPEGVQYHAPDLSRAEILVRLNALTDDNRLRILRLLLERDEMRSQEIITALDLSQSSVSRHLNQLCATGYLSERRCGGAKCYTLNAGRIRNTLEALSAFLLGG